MASPVLLCSEEAVGLDHDERIGCFHGEDEVVEVVLSGRRATSRRVTGNVNQAISWIRAADRKKKKMYVGT